MPKNFNLDKLKTEIGKLWKTNLTGFICLSVFTEYLFTVRLNIQNKYIYAVKESFA